MATLFEISGQNHALLNGVGLRRHQRAPLPPGQARLRRGSRKVRNHDAPGD